MASSKAINTIPTEYLRYAENVRIYDGGIWPRKWKQILTESTLWTNNKGGFIMWDKLYQITNSKIYEIDEVTGVQTEKATLWHDKRTDILVYGTFAVIASSGEQVKVFNWTAVSTPATQPANNNWILEYCRWFSFLASWNVLHISRPITTANPEFAYDWTWSWNQTITYDSVIKGLKGTMNWLYVFTEDKIEFLGANALQNVSWSATFISTPMWDWGELMENQLIATSGDKVFYVTKNLNINTVNYIQGTAEPWLWELSNRPVIWIRELLQWIDINQPSWFAFVNDNDNTVQFHLRTTWASFNNITLIYDLINDTWVIDTGKYYNNVIRKGNKYYGFSDINSSIYEDDTSNSDNGVAIKSIIRTQEMNLWAMQQKVFWGFFTSWGIWELTKLIYRVYVDRDEVFIDEIDWAILNQLWETWVLEWDWSIWWEEIWWQPIWWDVNQSKIFNPFDFEADVGRIYQSGIRASIEIESQSQIQDYIIDTLGIIAETTPFSDIRNKF